jgi:hypothetical protein
MRGTVLLADVGLELDDPADAGAPGGVGADQAGAQQGVRGFEGRPGEEIAIDDRGRAGRSRGQSPVPT